MCPWEEGASGQQCGSHRGRKGTQQRLSEFSTAGLSPGGKTLHMLSRSSKFKDTKSHAVTTADIMMSRSVSAS